VATLNGERRGSGAVVTVTRALAPGEGLAVAGSWPKGVVRAPTPEEQVSYFLHDNRSFVFAGVVLLAEALFLLGASGLLERGRRDAPAAARETTPDGPEAPPDGLSPAALRFALRGRADGRALGAALLSLEAKAAIEIARGDDGAFTVARAPGGAAAAAGLPDEERAAVSALFAGGGDSLRIDGAGAPALAAARRALRDSLGASLGQRYGAPAGGHALPALAFTAAGAAAAAAGTPAADGRAITVLLGLLLALGTATAAATTAASLRARRARAAAGAGRALARWLAVAGIVAADVALLGALGGRASPGAAAALAL